MQTISIYRPGTTSPVLSAKPNDDNSSLKQAIMGECLLLLSFYLPIMIELRIGDYTDITDAATGTTSRYYIHASKIPDIKKDSIYGYAYTLDMVSTQYLLQNAQLLQLDSANNFTQPDFSLYGTASDFIDLLLKNAARLGYPFKKGGIIQTGYKNITFENVDCLTALATIAEQFETEWFVDGFSINLAKKLQQTPYTFQYGKGKGLYDLTRRAADSSSIVTRLYVFGGNKNIPVTYRNGSERLLLPAVSSPSVVSDITYIVQPNGASQTMIFNWQAPLDPSVQSVTIFYRLTTGTGTTFTNSTGSKNSPRTLTLPAGVYEVGFRSDLPGGASVSTPTIIITGSSPYAVLPGTDQPYIEYNTELYGVIEKTLTFDDIYPHRTGTVTGVDALNEFIFTDTGIDFDINQQLLPGTSAKVVFNTGQLAGYTFKIKSFDFTTKKVTILKNEDEKTLDIPSSLLRPAIGDEYVLVDIIMPQSYIDAAEAQLLTKAQDYLNTYSKPVYTYQLTCDPKYFRQQKISLQYGDVVKVIDSELGVNQAMRILSVTKKLDDEYNYSLELGEAVSKGLISQIKSSITGNNNSISNINNQLTNSKESEGVFSQLTIESVDVASDVSQMKQLYIDANGKVWKH